MQQITGFMTNDFAIQDPDGTPIGNVHTTGSGIGRFFMGSRSFELYDADGRLLLSINDVLTFGRDRWELDHPDGSRFADIVRKFTFFIKKVDVQVIDGPLVQIESSDIFEFGFGITVGGAEIARTSRQWAGIGNALLGRDRYVLSFRPEVLRRDRLAVIGAVIAVDLMRQKDKSNG